MPGIQLTGRNPFSHLVGMKECVLRFERLCCTSGCAAPQSFMSPRQAPPPREVRALNLHASASLRCARRSVVPATMQLRCMWPRPVRAPVAGGRRHALVLASGPGRLRSALPVPIPNACTLPQTACRQQLHACLLLRQRSEWASLARALCVQRVQSQQQSAQLGSEVWTLQA